MTDREREMIEFYIPSPRDETLGKDEYYVKDTADRIRKVYLRDFFPHGEYIEHGVYEVGTDRRIYADYDKNPYRGFRMCFLYDNKEDCRDNTHSWYDGWEELRRIQREENDDVSEDS